MICRDRQDRSLRSLEWVITAIMSESADDNGIQDRLRQLRCHFTWGLEVEDNQIPDLENRVCEEIKSGDTKYHVEMHNLLAYVKHLKGRNEDALQNLKEAEDLIQAQHAEQADRRSLVTWGNYAWVHFHLGRVADAQSYLDRVENTCRMFANHSRYRVECPELDCEEGWALLKCGRKNYERARACFKKALDVEPENPDFVAGYAIVSHRLDYSYKPSGNQKEYSLKLLRKAVELNPDDAYVKVLLALQLQLVGKEDVGEEYIKEALNTMAPPTCVYPHAAKFYQKKNCWERAFQLLDMALQDTPNSSFVHFQVGSCYRAQIIQIKKATKMRPRGQDKENVYRLAKMAIQEFEKTLRLNPTFDMAYVYLAGIYAEIGQYRKAEENFKKAFCLKNLDDNTKQDIHYYYGLFQQFHIKSEDAAITHYKKGLEIRSFFSRGKLLCALEKLAESRVRRNPQDEESVHLLQFVHELKEEKEAAGQ